MSGNEEEHMKKAFKMVNPEAYEFMHGDKKGQGYIYSAVAWASFKEGWNCGKRYQDHIGREFPLVWRN